MNPDENRFFKAEYQIPPSIDYHYELIQSLERINTYNPPVHTCSTGWSFNGFYSGPTSVALLFYKLSQSYPDLEFRQQSLLEWANDYLNLSQHIQHEPPSPNHCGIANETLAFYALTSILNDDQSLTSKICSYEPRINSARGSNEWLYGRAGYLYILRLCRTHFEADSSAQMVVSLLNNTIHRTIEHILSMDRPWTWYGEEYLGAAHGYIGIITQIVLSSPSDRLEQVTQKFEELVDEILDTQLKSGNFEPSMERTAGTKDDRLVRFCHGSPGFLLSFRSINHFFSTGIQARINEASQKAEEDVWRRGLLVRVPCLCHGIAGNALSLSSSDKNKFAIFLAQMTTEQLEKHASGGRSAVSRGKLWLRDAGRTDDFVGLYTGEAGRAWIWAVADKNLDKTCLGYNDV